jgi:L-ascorbate metabolism protein UlaG (beta-lactamase superfamily)
MRVVFQLIIILALSVICCFGQQKFEVDTIKTASGDLTIHFIGHGTLYFTYNDLVIHVDPVARYADYTHLPKADLILVTHHHGDHLDAETIKLLSTVDTRVVLSEECFKQLGAGVIMHNGDSREIMGMTIEAVPAYNVVHKRDNGEPFHPKGIGNGYVVTFAEKRVYIAGDTENFPEMKDIKDINIAFLPMNLPYTMTPEMVADAVKILQPDILYPYHFGNSDTGELLTLLKDFKQCEIRLRKMK